MALSTAAYWYCCSPEAAGRAELMQGHAEQIEVSRDARLATVTPRLERESHLM